MRAPSNVEILGIVVIVALGCSGVLLHGAIGVLDLGLAALFGAGLVSGDIDDDDDDDDGECEDDEDVDDEAFEAA